jgi:hypothetical protein
MGIPSLHEFAELALPAGERRTAFGLPLVDEQDVAMHVQNGQLLAPPRRELGRRVARSAGEIGGRVLADGLQGCRENDHVEPEGGFAADTHTTDEVRG